MRKSLLYILSIAGLVSCSDDVVEQEKNVLNGSEKTPIAVVTNLTASYAQTRAVNKEFEGGEELLAYLQAGEESNSSFTKVDAFCNLETFHVLSNPTNQKYNDDNNVNYTDNLDCNSDDVNQKIFWDDYSNSTYPLTDSNRGIRLFYGYCYNGGAPNSGTALDTDEKKAAGTIEWTVATAPTAETFKKSDLLYAKTQEMIHYNHDPELRETLVLPYTHAMSKVTIEVICDEGFEADATKNFGSAVVTLKGMNTVCTVTAPTAEVSVGTTSADITMLKGTVSDDNKRCSYTALITPTVMKAGNPLATIKGIDGNDYNVVLSDEILSTADSPAVAWNTKLAQHDASTVTPESSGYNATNGGLTLPGVNYHLEVTVKKQEIKVKATIQDWETVSAAGVGTMDFTANIVSSSTSGTEFITNGAQFNLWRATVDGINGNYDEITSTTSVVDKATTLTYNTTPAGWTASPKIYWPNNSTNYYFRALAKYDKTAANYVGFEGEDAAHTATTDLKVSQGTDLIWGTTADHTGTKQEGGTQHYDKGAAINPRTSEVPMAFEHAMAKISVKLESAEGAEGVDVTGAKISIVNIYDGGTVSLTDGKIVDLTASSIMPILDFGDMNSSVTNKLNEFCVIPQSLVKDKNGTDRTGATTFYTPNDLTVIYSNGSSIGTDTSTTYVTSTLTPVYYSSEQAKEYNAGLTGHVTTESDKELAREYTLTEYNALSPLPHASINESDFNNISEAVKTKEAARPYTLTEFKELTSLTTVQFEHLPTALKTKSEVKFETQDEVDEYNAKIVGLVKKGDPKDPENSEAGSYTAEEAEQHNKDLGAKEIGDVKEEARIYTYDEYHVLSQLPHANITQEQLESMDVLYRTKPAVLYDLTEFQALTSLSQEQFIALPSTLRTRPAVKYTQDEADAYNAKLPGAKSTMDVHHYVTNGSSQTAVAGEIKSNGTKVVLHIMLADNTGYTLNLETCTDSNSNQRIYTWERGKHYIYTITLGKEEITFRALIKEWEEVTGGGNATLDW